MSKIIGLFVSLAVLLAAGSASAQDGRTRIIALPSSGSSSIVNNTTAISGCSATAFAVLYNKSGFVGCDNAATVTAGGLKVTVGSQIQIADSGSTHGLQLVGASGAVNTIGTLGASETLQFRVSAQSQVLLTGGLVAIGPAVTAANTFPALKRSTTTLQVRLADDSGYGGIDAGTYAASGAAGLTQTCTVNQALTLIFTNGILTGGSCTS